MENSLLATKKCDRLQNAMAKPFYIARKFESLVDIDAIALAEEQAMRDRWLSYSCSLKKCTLRDADATVMVYPVESSF